MKEKKPKVMAKEEQEISSRFVEEFARLRQPKNKVASEIGVTPQTFTNITMGYNLPSVSVLSKIKLKYPSFDTDYVIANIRTGGENETVRRLREEVESFKRIAFQLSLSKKNKGATIRPEVFIMNKMLSNTREYRAKRRAIDNARLDPIQHKKETSGCVSLNLIAMSVDRLAKTHNQQ